MAEDQLLARLQQELQQTSIDLTSSPPLVPEDQEGVERLCQLLQEEFNSRINDFEQRLETVNEEVLSTVEELNRFRAAELVKDALQTYQDSSFILNKTEKKLAAPKLRKKLGNCDRSSNNSTPEPAVPMSEDFRQKVRVVVGNTSQLLGPESRGPDPFTHKWMVYVRGGPEHPNIEKYVQKVELTLDASYSPHHIISLTKAPFNLTRRGWGEFPVRVLLHFHDSRNRPFEITHQLRLTNKLMDVQLCNGETTVDISLIMSEVLQQPTVVVNKRKWPDSPDLRSSKMVRTDMEDMKHVPDLSSLPLFDNEDPLEPPVLVQPKLEPPSSPEPQISTPPPQPTQNIVLVPDRQVKVENGSPPFRNLPPQLQRQIQEQKLKARASNLVRPPTPQVAPAPRLPVPTTKSSNGVLYIQAGSRGIITLDSKLVRLSQPSSGIRLAGPRVISTPLTRLVHPAPASAQYSSTLRLATSGTTPTIMLTNSSQLRASPGTIRFAQNPARQVKLDSLRPLTSFRLVQPTQVKVEQSASQNYLVTQPLVKQEFPPINLVQLDTKKLSVVNLKPSSTILPVSQHFTPVQLRPNSPSSSSIIKVATPIVKKESLVLKQASLPRKLFPLHTSSFSKPVVLKDVEPLPAKTIEQCLESLRGRSFQDGDMLLSRVAELYPLCGPTLDVTIHPYTAHSSQEFLGWKFWRRRAAEWQRAHAIRQALSQCGQTQVKLSTKQILLWCRRFGYTPLNQADSPSPSSGVVCTLTEAGPLPAESEDGPPLEDEEEEIDVGDKEYEEVEETKPQQVQIKPAKPLPSAPLLLLPPQCPQPAALEYVKDCCSQIGVALHPEEVSPGIAAPVAEEILLQACRRFTSQLLQASFRKTFKRTHKSSEESVGEVTKLDVFRGIQELDFQDLLTNAGLGTKPEVGGWTKPL